MAELYPVLCLCKHGIGNHINELGEREVYCELTARWMNVTLGDCLGNCESEDWNRRSDGK
jgi:hypothetical protein